MTLLTANGLSKYFGAQDVFHDISLRIEPQDRIGLVGPNGEGKTTLLRILAGIEEPSAGEVEMRRGLSVAYLPQQAELQAGDTLYRAMLPAFSSLLRQQTALGELENEMAQRDCPAAIYDRYGKLQSQFELAGGYSFESQIRQVLAGLGFGEDEFDKPLAIMSGGQRTRALLAKTLLTAPDLLLLDEPTNHLDLDGIEWLERYLAGWKGGMVVVAHDRRFLDKLTNRIWDLDDGQLESYEGDYSRYLTLREQRLRRRQAEYESQQEEILRTESFIRRYQAGQRSREARGRLRRLQRVQRLERPRESRRIHLDIQTDVRSGDLVLRALDLEVGFAGPPRLSLMRCADLLLLRGERAAILGPNGSGKTTLARTIVGELSPLTGRVQLGANVRLGYLAQAHAGLHMQRTVLDEILETRNLPLAKARNFLGRFLFSGDEIYKTIGQLSGGERSRVALAKLTLQGANFLILDEPTNHLDIASQEILEDVLNQFRGTILMISHDRHFIDSLATQVWMIQKGELVTYSGTYTEHLASTEGKVAGVSEETVRAGNAEEKERKERLREERRRQREERRRQEQCEEIEETIASLESASLGLEHRLEKASLEQRTQDIHQLGQEYERLQVELERLMEEWITLQ